MIAFSNALQGTVNLGLKQGLAKGLAIGSNGFVFAIWSFMCYYGSRLVMYHGAKGGTVFAVGATIALGGLWRVLLMDSQWWCKWMKKLTFEGDSLEGENVAGKTVALVGESGSGKSTLIALLQRFYDPIGGEILVDGVAINKLNIKWLRSIMGLVSQEPSLFATSIKENIIFGKEDATEDEIVEAAKICNAHDFISLLPQGYNTQVGERGVQLSGGQKQRIAIARAIIKKPRILLLDEATSALDTKSERLVQQALDNATIDCTTIVIAHRLSTIQNANIIAVVHGGKINEIGSHNELLQNNTGVYSSLVHNQQTDKERVEEETVTTTFTKRDPQITCFVDPTTLVEDEKNNINNVNFNEEYLTKRVRESMLSKIITFEVAWFDCDENSSGAVCSRLANDANVGCKLNARQLLRLISISIRAVTIQEISH
ncbi:ABC transporter B family member 15-like protein [Trifolium pratense]|uniref:ABC transporter B family member 15-like protein n=2 Tax=Trifolium pratense TaxID=57577 RepID=A0A2K3PS61_TRIPR|nr:ABC transporter B family member 15-like protein [Trifolium pratense]